MFDLDRGRGQLERAADPSLLDHWRIATNAERTADELRAVVQEFLGFHGFTFDDEIDGIAISLGRARVTAALRRDDRALLRLPRRSCSSRACGPGMPILYDNPNEVGADRIANAVGAFDLYGGPSIVIDFGTATTFDAMSAKGEYLGGAISPGIDISLDALSAGPLRCAGSSSSSPAA